MNGQGIDAIFHCDECSKIHILENKFTEDNISGNKIDLKKQLDSRINDLSFLKNALSQIIAKGKYLNFNNKIKGDIQLLLKKIREDDKILKKDLDWKNFLVLTGSIIYLKENYKPRNDNTNQNLVLVSIKEG